MVNIDKQYTLFPFEIQENITLIQHSFNFSVHSSLYPVMSDSCDPMDQKL